MADEADKANDVAQNWLDAQLAAQLARSAGAGQIGPEACAECGESMPMARRLHGYSRCVECAEDAEKRGDHGC